MKLEGVAVRKAKPRKLLGRRRPVCDDTSPNFTKLAKIVTGSNRHSLLTCITMHMRTDEFERSM